MKNSKTNKIVSKKTIIENIHEIVNDNDDLYSMNKKQIGVVIDSFLMEINKSLIDGKDIRLPNHFTLKTTIQKERIAINLQTKKKMKVPAKRVPKVKFSDELKKQIAEKK